MSGEIRIFLMTASYYLYCYYAIITAMTLFICELILFSRHLLLKKNEKYTTRLCSKIGLKKRMNVYSF